VAAGEKWIASRADWESPTQRQLYRWILDGCRPFDPAEQGDEKKARKEVVSRLPRSSQLQLQVAIFAVLQGLQSAIFSKQACWLWGLLQRTDEMATAYMAGYGGGGMQELMGAMGHIGWYQCANGHLYTVGNCTYPMEQSRCPECGSVIGGRMHVTAKGTRRLDAANLEAQTTVPGYPAAEKEEAEPPLDGGSRLSPLAAASLRFFLHSVLWVGMSISSAARDRIAAFVGFDGEGSRALRYREAYDHVRLRCHRYWVAMLHTAAISPDELAVGLVHMLADSDIGAGGMLQSTHEKAELEGGVGQLVQLALLPPFSLVKRGFLDTLQDQGRSLCRAALGEGLWSELVRATERNSAEVGGESPVQLLWYRRTPSTMAAFGRGLKSFVEPNHLMLLKLIVAQEEQLSIVKLLADVLAWHRVLFTALSGVKLSREEAGVLTNEEVIERHVPVHERKEAYAVLGRYCTAFNAAFRHVHFLYECNANPFLDKNGRVDLTGGSGNRAGMGRRTPVSFSLPSMIQGDADAAGLCTIQLVATLQNAHTQLLEQARAVHLGRFHQLPRNRREPGGHAGEEVVTLNFMTPTRLVQQMLLDYDRARDLEPLLSACRVPSAAGVDFDYAAIEAALGSRLLADKQPLTVHVHHFVYAGEMKRKGKLGSLRLRLPQEPLPAAVYQAIIAEVDTQHHAAQLMSHVEVCVNLLTAVGGAGNSGLSVDGSMKLEDYLLRCLLVGAADWEQLTTTNISRHVFLRHMQSLVMCLEEVMHGSPLDAVHSSYRQPLLADLEQALVQARGGLLLDSLLPTFHDFLVDQLASGGFPASESLKQYLTYADFDLEEEAWFQDHFPASLCLAHAFEAYHLLV